MAEPFLSEIRIFSFVFAPKGWALCNGQLLPINQNQALFSLLGTTFGGDGRVNFALPDLRGRMPIHVGAGHTLGREGRRAGAHAVDRRDADAYACAATHPTERQCASVASPSGTLIWRAATNVYYRQRPRTWPRSIRRR